MYKAFQKPVFFFCLVSALILYGLFGSPTPDNPGMAELGIGGFLILAVLLSGFAAQEFFILGQNFFLKSLQVFFITGLIVPTVTGVYYNNDQGLILRDLLSFMFLGLPLFLAGKIAEDRSMVRWLAIVMAGCGVAFSIRTLMPAFNIWIPQGELLYLSNSPLTLFAAVLCAGGFFKGLCGLPRMRLAAWGGAAACLALLAVLIAAMLLDVQRATIGAVILSLLFLAAAEFIKAPARALLPCLILAGGAAFFYPLIGEALTAMAEKTASVGMNMRVAEITAVYERLASAPETVFIGAGWGAVFSSPAVAGLDVNYTHSLLSGMMLKGGAVMALLAVIVTLAGLYQIFLIFQKDRLHGLALFWAFTIPVFLYASYKSLDFGLVLLLIGVWSIAVERLHPPVRSDRKKEHI
ncbi:MAG: hypothetical protein WCY59_00070 [Anaerovoracaceae bacterium]